MQLSKISSTPQLAAIWLGALIDGEGCVWKGQLKRGDVRRSISIGMTDYECIRFASACCTTLGIKHNLYENRRRDGNKPCLVLTINGRLALARAASLIQLTHIAKAAKLADITASFKPRLCTRCGIERPNLTKGCDPCDQLRWRRARHDKAAAAAAA